MENSVKYQKLLTYLKGLERVVIAFSGGVDSTFLAKAAKEALGDNAIAVTVDSPYIPRWELKESKELAEEIGIQHVIMPITEIPESIKDNPENRCYLCKKEIFSRIIEKAKSLDATFVVDGTNYDDTKDYRPGMVALKELKVKSPLLETEWTKNEIRESSKSLDLPTHNKPAYACLLTRIPYFTTIEVNDLRKIEAAETYMMSIGFKAIRVRSHGDLARIEVAREDRKKLFDETLLDEISDKIKAIGFTYVTIEASGYKMGSFNKKIGQ